MNVPAGAWRHVQIFLYRSFGSVVGSDLVCEQIVDIQNSISADLTSPGIEIKAL